MIWPAVQRLRSLGVRYYTTQAYQKDLSGGCTLCVGPHGDPQAFCGELESYDWRFKMRKSAAIVAALYHFMEQIETALGVQRAEHTREGTDGTCR